MSAEERTSSPPRSPQQPMRPSMPPPETLPSSPDPPYIPAPYLPPPSVHRRPGLGNFVVLHDPATHGSKTDKAVIKRFDGVIDGAEVNVQDPRLKLPEEARRKGRGSAKSRTGLYELEYEVSRVYW